MEIGLQLYGPVACGQMEIKDMLKAIKELGIAGIEPCVTLDGKNNNPSFWTMDMCREIIPFAKELGLYVISCHVSAEDLLGSADAMIELAQKYGLKHFVMGVGEASKEAVIKQAAIYRELSDIVSESGADLWLHNGKTDIATKIDGKTAYEYMADCCEGKIAMQFDTGWAARGGEDPLTVIRRNANRIACIHYKDFDMSVDSDVDTCIGDGTLDNGAFKRFALDKDLPQMIDADTYIHLLEDVAKSYNYLTDVV